jgi:hypothetical protein
LYLIILIVIAAIVVVILLGWLSSIQHPTIGSVATTVGGSSTMTISGTTSCSGTAYWCFTPDNATGGCRYTYLQSATQPAVQIQVQDSHGNPLGGVTVTLTANSGVNITGANIANTGSNGIAAFSTLTGSVNANTQSATISVSASYGSGGTPSTDGGGTIIVDPPAGC